VPPAVRQSAASFLAGLRKLVGEGSAPAAASGPLKGDEAVVYRRAADPKGPMTGFGYGYLDDKLAEKKIARPALLGAQGLWGGGSEYAYETLNLVDGRRTVRQIHDDVSAIYGPVPAATVIEYLADLEKIGVLVR
jgi:hypothetical protein